MSSLSKREVWVLLIAWLGVACCVTASSNDGATNPVDVVPCVTDIANADEDEDYILFAPLNGTAAVLIDRAGDVVHEWTLSGQPGNSVYLLAGGDLLATYTIDGTFGAGGAGGGVERLTWSGEEVWSFELATQAAQLHHDVAMLPNGNALMISWEEKTKQQALAVGLSAGQLPASGKVWSEMILEYDPDSDRIVWEWHLWDHALPEGWSASDHPEKIDLDAFANRRSEDWWHLNSIDYSPELDQIVVSSRAASEIWIIDHNLTTADAAGAAGDLLYRFGNPATVGGSGQQVLYGQHDAEFISERAILLFDNGDPQARPYSRVVELDLPDYLENRENSQFEEADIIWSYGAAFGDEAFFADHISGAQRLNDGNTLICVGTEGRFIEVTSDGEIVWEYVNPFSGLTSNGRTSNEVFRCEAYSADHIGRALDSPSSQGSGQPFGIVSFSPASIEAGVRDALVTIQLDAELAPPEQVRFTRVAIGRIEATRWTRDGLTVRAWFDIPSQLHNGRYGLTLTFHGQDGEPITFGATIPIR